MLITAFLGVSAYSVSFTKADITDTDFSVSQALAHGEPVAMIVLLTGGIIALTGLIIYRGHNQVRIRVSLNIILGALIISIMWVSMNYNPVAHYCLSAATVVLLITGIAIDNHVIHTGGYHCAGFIVNISISVALFMGAMVVSFRSTDDINTKTELQMLYALELFLVAVKLLSILTLGFT